MRVNQRVQLKPVGVVVSLDFCFWHFGSFF